MSSKNPYSSKSPSAIYVNKNSAFSKNSSSKIFDKTNDKKMFDKKKKNNEMF